MAVRSNVGNVAANGLQTGIISTTTGVRMTKQDRYNKEMLQQRKLGDAASALNNIGYENAQRVGKMRGEKLMAEVESWENRDKEGLDSVDNIMSNVEPIFKDIPQSREMQELNKNVQNNLNWSTFWSEQKTENEPIENILKEVNSNANS